MKQDKSNESYTTPFIKEVIYKAYGKLKDDKLRKVDIKGIKRNKVRDLQS